jgi:TolB-like protein
MVVMAMLKIQRLVLVCACAALSCGVALAEDKEKTADGKAAKSAATAHKDRKGSVQEGIQSLVNRLVLGMQKAVDVGFRRMAVLPFKTLESKAKESNLGRVSSELLSSRLALNPRILQVERSRLDSVISELKRSERGELSKDGAVSVGKLLGANNIVLGSVAVSGADYLITARVVDSETGRVVTAADQIFPQAGMVAISEEMVEVKSRFNAAMRSMVVPGWGQVYNGDLGRGLVYGATFFGLAAGAITSTILGNQAKDAYNENTRSTVDEREVANGHYDRVNYFLLGLGTLWAVAVSDAYITGRDATTINVDAVPGVGTGSVSITGSF